ncbi:MAG: hypothetical protein HY000_42310 [Planctomycetes bacterium]|nr:hypothetical protein [Planctomycetota bacterium]
MMQRIQWWTGAAVLLCSAFLIGCYGQSSQPAKPKPSGPATSGAAGGGQGHDAKGHEAEEHAAGQALSPEDQSLADAQKICPVSGEELGSMGSPVKELVKGEPVFLCCKSCIKKLHSDEDKFLAKVAELKKGNAAEGKPEEKKPEEN